jgi:hypothetical protein
MGRRGRRVGNVTSATKTGRTVSTAVMVGEHECPSHHGQRRVDCTRGVICRDVVIEARPDKVGAALRDWGALHTDHTRLRQRR